MYGSNHVFIPVTTETKTPDDNKGQPASTSHPWAFFPPFFCFFLLMKALVTNLAFIIAIYKLKQ